MKKTKKPRSMKIKEKALTLDEVFAQISLTPTTTPGGLNNIVLTPLSSEACLRNGINPDHLRKRQFETFYENDQIDLDIQRLKYETYDRRRQDLMGIAAEEKRRMFKKNSCERSVAGSVTSLTPSAILREEEKANSKLIEMEEKRLRKAKEKQKRELLQLLHFEQKMENVQTSMRNKAEQEALEQEKKKSRKIKQERRAAEERRLRELRRRAQEDAEEEMQRINARQRFEKERQFEIENEQARLAKKEGLLQLEEERQKKRELQRKQQKKQQEIKRRAIEKKLQERDMHERERQIRIEKKRAMDQYELEKKRKQAADRIALNKEAARRNEEERQQVVVEKRIKAELQNRKITVEREQQREAAKKEKVAINRKREYQAKLARDREEEMKAKLLKKFEESEKNVNEMKEMKEKDKALLKEERCLHTQLKRENVERIRRMQEYKQVETMRKVEEGNKRTEEMQKKRDELVKIRRTNAVEAKIRKDKLMQTLEKSKTSGGAAIKKILSELSSDDVDTVDRVAVKKKRKKKKKQSVSSKQAKESSCNGDGYGHKKPWDGNGMPPSIIEICGPPPEAPSLLARIAEESEKEQESTSFVSPYASSPFGSMR